MKVFRGKGKLTAEQQETKQRRAIVKRLEMKKILKKATIALSPPLQHL